MNPESPLNQLKAKLLANPDVQAEYDAITPYAELAKAITQLRIEQGLTQSELAKRIGTTQSAISRIESLDYGRIEFQTLEKIAAALGKRLHVSFLEAS